MRLDLAEVEEVVDDGTDARGLVRDPLGELFGDLGILHPGECLGEHGERAHRRLELVAHVGDEVAPDRLDAPRLGDVAHQPDRADAPGVGDERTRGHEEDLGRRPEELQLAGALLAVPGPVEQLPQRTAGERVGMAGVVEAFGGAVAQHDLAGRVHDHDGVTDRVQRLREPSAVEIAGDVGCGSAVVAELGATTSVHPRSSSSFHRAAVIRTVR